MYYEGLCDMSCTYDEICVICLVGYVMCDGRCWTGQYIMILKCELVTSQVLDMLAHPKEFLYAYIRVDQLGRLMVWGGVGWGEGKDIQDPTLLDKPRK